MKTNTWMANLDPSVKLIDLWIPASHDSSAYPKKDNNQGIPPRMGSITGSITQCKDYKEQLKAGIRYFDVRCVLDGGQIHLHHGIINGGLFENVLRDQIIPFSDQHPSEIIFLDIDLKQKEDRKPILDIINRHIINSSSIATEHLNHDGSFNTECTWGDLRNNNRKFVITWSSPGLYPLFGDWTGVYSSPNIAEFNGAMYMILLDKTGSIYIAKSSDASNGQPKKEVSNQRLFGDWSGISSTPTLASFKGELYMCILDKNGGLYIAKSSDGLTWQPKQEVLKQRLFDKFHGTDYTPSLAVFNEEVYMCLLDYGGSVYMSKSSDGLTWIPTQHIFGDWSGVKSNPNLAVFNGELYLCILDNSGRIYISKSSDGLTWSKEETDNQRLFGDWSGTPSTPTLASFNGELYMCLLDNPGNVYISRSSDGLTWSKEETDNQRLFGEWSGLSSTPTLATFNGKMFMCLLDNPGSIYLSMSYNGLTWIPTTSAYPWLSFNSYFRYSASKGFSDMNIDQILDALDNYVEQWHTNRDRMFIAQVLDTPHISFKPGHSPIDLESKFGSQLNAWVEKPENKGKLNIIFRDMVNNYPEMIQYVLRQNKFL